ncbi:MAG: isoprenylcysteine carboxylmethyltransferase family protein [Acidobacteria bacterium]|nr:isoprenylcysteine carboxylmethyltransferase family protein [Acidobacteriota bacterium]
MDNQTGFRIALALLFLVMLVGAGRFRLRSRTKEQLDRRQEGIPMLILLRLAGLIAWGSVVVWIVSPGLFAFARVGLPDLARWCGMVVGLLCILWIGWVMRSLGANLTDTVVTREKAYLVTAGPYRWIRHPLYTGVIPSGVFLSMVTATWWFLMMTAVIFVLLWLRTAKEERNLEARFGHGYRAYMAQTGRFLPRV